MKKLFSKLLLVSSLCTIFGFTAALAAGGGVQYPDNPMDLSVGFVSKGKQQPTFTLTVAPSRVGSSFLVTFLEESDGKKLVSLFLGTLLIDRTIGLNILAPSADGLSYVRNPQPEGILRFVVNDRKMIEKVVVYPQPSALVLPSIEFNRPTEDVAQSVPFLDRESYSNRGHEVQINRSQTGVLMSDIDVAGIVPPGIYSITNLVGLGVIRALSYDSNYKQVESPTVAGVLLKSSYKGKNSLFVMSYAKGSPRAVVQILKRD